MGICVKPSELFTTSITHDEFVNHAARGWLEEGCFCSESCSCLKQKSEIVHALSYFKVPVIRVKDSGHQQFSLWGVYFNSQGSQNDYAENLLAKLVNAKINEESIYLHLASLRLSKGRKPAAQSILRASLRNCSHTALTRLALASITRRTADNFHAVNISIQELLNSPQATDIEKQLAYQVLLQWQLILGRYEDAEITSSHCIAVESSALNGWLALVCGVLQGNTLVELASAAGRVIEDLDAEMISNPLLMASMSDQLAIRAWVNRKSEAQFVEKIQAKWMIKPVCEWTTGWNDSLELVFSYAYEASDKVDNDDIWCLLACLNGNPENLLYSDNMRNRLEVILPKYHCQLLERHLLMARWWSGDSDPEIVLDIIAHDREYGSDLLAPLNSPLLATTSTSKNIVSTRATEIINAINSGLLREQDIKALWLFVEGTVTSKAIQNHTRLIKFFDKILDLNS